MGEQDQNKNARSRSKKEVTEEQEKLDILAKADRIKGEQLTITAGGAIERENELRQFALGAIEDPERKFDIYYNGIQKLLRTHLPKGKEYKAARDYIYEEKNTFLTRGKRINRQGIRHADGRMGYISDADEMLKIIMEWIMENGTMVELFNKLRDLNVVKGYGTRIF